MDQRVRHRSSRGHHLVYEGDSPSSVGEWRCFQGTVLDAHTEDAGALTPRPHHSQEFSCDPLHLSNKTRTSSMETPTVREKTDKQGFMESNSCWLPAPAAAEGRSQRIRTLLSTMPMHGRVSGTNHGSDEERTFRKYKEPLGINKKTQLGVHPGGCCSS